MPDPEIAPARPDEELDHRVVDAWIRERMPELEGPPEVLQFRGGHANLTYLLRFGERELVLRRPPHGTLAPGAHDMVREHKVLSRLWRHLDLAPRAYLLCEDESVIGAPFFVMERRRGVVVREAVPEALAGHPDVERRISFALVDAMAALHEVDFEAAGLADLGRPEGFVDRQLRGWMKRWELAKREELPAFDRLHERLVATQPESGPPSLVHNDLKLDNCQFDPADPDHVRTIFDWDMTTLGDPLVDLGTLLAYWTEARSRPQGAVAGVMAGPRFPSRDEVAQRYAERRGIAPETLDWYEAFAFWKTAVVVQQLYGRYRLGHTKDERLAAMGPRIPALVELGWAAVPASS